MAIKEQITLDEFIAVLNAIAKTDPVALGDLVGNRVPCNLALASHPSVQTTKISGDTFTVGMLGIMNGIFGTYSNGKRKGWGPIMVTVELDGRVTKVERTPNG